MSKMLAERVSLAEHSRQIHRVKPDAETPLKELLDADYWVHVAAKFHVGDKLEIFPEGGAWYAEALVVSCSRIHAKLLVLVHEQIDVVKVDKDKKIEPFYHAYRGGTAKHSVMRTSDKAVVKEGFDSRAAADTWLEENLADLKR